MAACMYRGRLRKAGNVDKLPQPNVAVLVAPSLSSLSVHGCNGIEALHGIDLTVKVKARCAALPWVYPAHRAKRSLIEGDRGAACARPDTHSEKARPIFSNPALPAQTPLLSSPPKSLFERPPCAPQDCGPRNIAFRVFDTPAFRKDRFPAGPARRPSAGFRVGRVSMIQSFPSQPARGGMRRSWNCPANVHSVRSFHDELSSGDRETCWWPL